MKRWAILVAALYCLILVALTLPVTMLAFAHGLKDVNLTNLKKSCGLYAYWPYWAWLVVMGLAQAALLAVPVRFASRRPVTRGSLLPTVMASGLMMGGMAAGMVLAVYEFAAGKPDLPERDAWCVLGLLLLTWCLWSLIFFRWGRSQNADDFMARQNRTMLRGSILELLVAVPTHVVARNRTDCCAGFMTFVGLAMGLSVMLFSFGPSVFFLFTARWRQIHRND